MTESVIVYRNRSEEAIDQFLYDSGAGAWIIPVVCALVVGSVVYALVNRQARRYMTIDATHGVSLAAGFVAGGGVFFTLAAPLWG